MKTNGEIFFFCTIRNVTFSVFPIFNHSRAFSSSPHFILPFHIKELYQALSLPRFLTFPRISSLLAKVLATLLFPIWLPLHSMFFFRVTTYYKAFTYSIYFVFKGVTIFFYAQLNSVPLLPPHPSSEQLH